MVGIANERKSTPRVGFEPVDGVDQPDRRDLLEVVQVLAPVPMPAGDVVRHRQVSLDQLGPQELLPRIVSGEPHPLGEQGRQVRVVVVTAFRAPGDPFRHPRPGNRRCERLGHRVVWLQNGGGPGDAEDSPHHRWAAGQPERDTVRTGPELPLAEDRDARRAHEPDTVEIHDDRPDPTRACVRQRGGDDVVQQVDRGEVDLAVGPQHERSAARLVHADREGVPLPGRPRLVLGHRDAFGKLRPTAQQGGQITDHAARDDVEPRALLRRPAGRPAPGPRGRRSRRTRRLGDRRRGDRHPPRARRPAPPRTAPQWTDPPRPGSADTSRARAARPPPPAKAAHSTSVWARRPRRQAMRRRTSQMTWQWPFRSAHGSGWPTAGPYDVSLRPSAPRRASSGTRERAAHRNVTARRYTGGQGVTVITTHPHPAGHRDRCPQVSEAVAPRVSLLFPGLRGLLRVFLRSLLLVSVSGRALRHRGHREPRGDGGEDGSRHGVMAADADEERAEQRRGEQQPRRGGHTGGRSDRHGDGR